MRAYLSTRITFSWSSEHFCRGQFKMTKSVLPSLSSLLLRAFVTSWMVLMLVSVKQPLSPRGIINEGWLSSVPWIWMKLFVVCPRPRKFNMLNKQGTIRLGYKINYRGERWFCSYFWGKQHPNLQFLSLGFTDGIMIMDSQ